MFRNVYKSFKENFEIKVYKINVFCCFGWDVIIESYFLFSVVYCLYGIVFLWKLKKVICVINGIFL